jgi:Ca-activated chloride channel homolog
MQKGCGWAVNPPIMKPLLRLSYFVVIYSALVWFAPAAEVNSAAPYFQVVGNSDNTVIDQLPLKSADAKVVIDGTIARIHLTQCFANSGRKPLEAIYVFPASTRSAVHGMTLRSGGRVIEARIGESVKTKEEYQKAKSDKKTAALLEEHRANVFQMSVSNLLPGEDVEVEIEWTEIISASDSTYEFVFPTVVGPRYVSGTPREEKEAWTGNPHLRPDQPNPASLSLNVSLKTSLDLAEVKCPSHPVVIDFKSKDRAEVCLVSKAGEESANRDFILRWKHSNDHVDAGLLLHRGNSMNHFMLQIEPPPRLPIDQIPPRDYVFVVDISGSMAGFPLDTAKELLRDLVRGLRTEDTFNVVSFASGSGVLSEVPLAASHENIAEACQFIDGRHAGGGTELEAALKEALALPGGADRSRSVLLITDGYVSGDESVKKLVRNEIGNANLFAFGIGSSVNRDLLEGVARAGGGEPTIVTSGKDAATSARRFREMVSNPVLSKIRVEAEGVVLNDIEPAIHPDVFASRPLIITGAWKGELKGRIVVRGIVGNGRQFERSLSMADSVAAKGFDHPSLPVLWAREKVRSITEGPKLNHEMIQEVTALGLTYSMLTPYTSFLAIDHTPKMISGLAETTRQPLPLPQGVSTAAIEGARSGAIVQNGSVPEPASIGLVSVLAVLLALQRRR